MAGTGRMSRRLLLLGQALHQAEPGDPPPVVLDAFSDLAGVSLDTHVPTVCPPGSSWVEHSGNWLVNTAGQAVIVADSLPAVASFETGLADCSLAVDSSSASNGSGAHKDSGLALRISDAQNYWQVTASALAPGAFRIVEVNGGVRTVRAQAVVAQAPGSVHRIAATLQGATISATLDGGSPLVYNGATFNQSATRHGLQSFSTTEIKDNFEVRAL